MRILKKFLQNLLFFLCNYPISVAEYLIPSLLPTDVCLLSSNRAEKALKLIYNPEDYMVFADKNKNSFDYLKQRIEEMIKTRSMFVYVENTDRRIHDFHVGKIRSGMFHIAKKIGATITPVAIDGIIVENGIIHKQNFQINVGETKLVEDPKIDLLNTRMFLLKNKRRFKKEKYESKKF